MTYRVSVRRALPFLCVVLFAFLGLVRPALAVPVTLTFNEFGSADTVPVAAGGGIGYSNSNHMTYGNVAPNILLGDDGYSSRISFSTDAGTVFDPLRLTLLEGRNGVYQAPLQPGQLDPWDHVFAAMSAGTASQLTYDNIIIEGYRWDALIAQTSLYYDGQQAQELLLPSNFTDLTRLDIQLSFNGANLTTPLLTDASVIYCDASCGYLRFDDLDVDLTTQPVAAAALVPTLPPVTSMPIPGAGPMLLLTLAGLGLFRRLR